MQAVILAGGQGTRLKSITSHIPKPMVPIADIPLLEHQIILLKRYGFLNVFILVNHLKESIISYFGTGKKWGVSIHYHEELEPLGTVGGIKAIENLLTDNFLVLYGDVMVDMDLSRLISFHAAKESECTLVLHPNDHPYDSDLVDIDNNERIINFYSNPHSPERYYRNLVNAGVYLFTGKIFKHLENGKKADFGKDIFPKVYNDLRMFGYNTTEYLKDMGTPDRLEKVNADYKSGKINRKSYSHLQKTIFLDRDGVLNVDKHLIHAPEDLELFPTTSESIKKINQSDYLAIVATNQPVVARNLCTEQELQVIHNKLDTLLGIDHAKLDAIYYCPHHPDKGFEGENVAYKITCDCRKPKPGMLLKAAEKFNIDLSASYFIGDHQRDIEAGKRAGVTTVGVMTGKGLKDTSIYPDYFFSDLKEAVDFIVDEPYEKIFEQLKNSFHTSSQRPYVIVVGGNFLSGKSTLITYLQKSLLKNGLSSFHINLDYWLNESAEDKEISEPVEMLNAVQKILNGATVHRHAVEFNMQHLPTTEYSFKQEDVIIMEGTTALYFDKVRAMAQVRIFKQVEDGMFKKRAEHYYRWQGKDENEIKILIKNLEETKYNVIDKLQNFADVVI